jgi:hypothetical protein
MTAYDKERAVVCFDGDPFQIRAVDKCILNHKNKNIEFFKLAASCSMTRTTTL